MVPTSRRSRTPRRTWWCAAAPPVPPTVESGPDGCSGRLRRGAAGGRRVKLLAGPREREGADDGVRHPAAVDVVGPRGLHGEGTGGERDVGGGARPAAEPRALVGVLFAGLVDPAAG